MALEILDTVASTMDVARENVAAGRRQYDGVMAWEQTAGRGQRGRAWYAPPGECLCATYCLRRRFIVPQDAGQIAFLAGVAVADALRQTLSRFPEMRIGLKWPNDLLLNGRKVGGILIEMIRSPEGDWAALVGVGVNVLVTAFPPEFAHNATSLALETGASFAVKSLAETVQETLQLGADRLETSGFEAVLERWRELDETPGRRFQAEMDGVEMQGVAAGVDAAGALRLRLADGREVAVTSASSLRERPHA
jgi:BirA family biotin operon repressor/biotin-[acetyl-CoA-carboxylase] ligase